MCVAAAIPIASAVFGAYGAYTQASAAKQQARYASQVAANNAQVAEWQAQDAIKRGEEDAQRVQREAAQLKGRQRVAMAVNGLDLTAGTAQELQDQTDFFGQQDAATARNNGRRGAWGARVQGANFQAESIAQANKARSISPGFAAATSLLGSASSVSDKWKPPPSQTQFQRDWQGVW